MIEMQLIGVRLEMPSGQPLVMIRESHGSRVIPILVGIAEATAIAVAHEGIEPVRPLTHDLLVEVIKACGRKIHSVAIPRMESGVFYGELRLDDGTAISSRASDAIAVAQRAHCQMWCAREVLEEAGVILGVDEVVGEVPEQGQEEQLRRFRVFLDDVRPEDFRN